MRPTGGARGARGVCVCARARAPRVLISVLQLASTAPHSFFGLEKEEGTEGKRGEPQPPNKYIDFKKDTQVSLQLQLGRAEESI